MTESTGPYEPYPTSGGQNTGAPTPESPNTINIAFYCYLLSAVISVIGAVLLFGDKQAVVNALRNANATSATKLTEGQIQQAAQLTLVAAVVIAIVIALIYLWLAFKLRAGRNWARIVLAILTVLQVLSLLTGNGGSLTGYLSVLVAVVAFVFACLPQSNQYIAARKRPRG